MYELMVQDIRNGVTKVEIIDSIKWNLGFH